MKEKEVAYHEAGHAVLGYLFYPPVKLCTIIPKDGRLGSTISEIPVPLFGEFQKKDSSSDYFKIALYTWSGEYFQRIVSSEIDKGGLVVDEELLTFYCDNNEIYRALTIYKQDISDAFFQDKEICNMVYTIANDLLDKKKLYESDINLLLSRFNVDVQGKVNSLVEKFHQLICDKLSVE